MNYKRLEVYLEFLIFGVLMGVVEDFVAVYVVTGRILTLKSILIIILIAIPFAVVGELIVDRIELGPKKSKS